MKKMKRKISTLTNELLNLKRNKKVTHVEITGKFRLGKWLVDPTLGRITHGGQHVDVQPQIMAMLVFFASRHKQIISMDTLLSNLWKDRIVTSASIYTSLKQLRAVLGDDAQNPEYIETIPKKGYRLIADLDLETDHGRRVAPPGQSGANKPGNGKSWPGARLAWFVVVLVIVLAVVNFPVNKEPELPSLPGDTRLERSIVVLPFSELEEERGYSWYSDGITDDIAGKLAETDGLKVIGRQSSFMFRGTRADPATIGSALGVSYLLEGSVQRNGERIQLDVSLTRAKDGHELWSQNYDRLLENTMTIKDEISDGIAGVLLAKEASVSLPGEARTPVSVHPGYSAYELYQQSRHLMEQGTKHSLLLALEKLKKALKLEPDYVEAHIAISRVYRSLMKFTGFYEEDMHRESDALIWPHLERALAINPELAGVQHLLGDMSDEVELALSAYEKALSINPNLYQVYLSLATLTSDQLRSWNDPVAYLDTAIELEPLSIETSTMLVHTLQRIPHRWQQAEGIIADLEQQYPGQPAVLSARAQWLIYVQGRPAEAVPLMQQLLIEDPDNAFARMLLSRSWYMLGETGRALEFAIQNPIFRYVLAPDREDSLEQMIEVKAKIESWPREETYAWRMLYAYAFMMLRKWRLAVDLLAEDAVDPEAWLTSIPEYVQQLARIESPAMTLATAYKNLGDLDNYQRFADFERMALNARSENGKLHNQEYSRALAKLYALDEKPYRALLELEHQVAEGRIDPRDLINPAFDGLRDDAGFKKIEQLQLERVNQQRELLGLSQIQLRDLQRPPGTKSAENISP